MRDTEFYKTLTPYKATAIAEGFDDYDADEDEQLSAWQYLHDTGIAYQLQGRYGCVVQSMIKRGLISA